MCHPSKTQKLAQAAADLHQVATDIRQFQDQQKALHLLHDVADRLTVITDQTEMGDISLHLSVVKARNTATEAMVLMIADDGLVQDVANVASSLATVARWHVQRAHRASQRSQWSKDADQASNA